MHARPGPPPPLVQVIETTEKTEVGMQQMANPRVATLLMYLTGKAGGAQQSRARGGRAVLALACRQRCPLLQPARPRAPLSAIKCEDRLCFGPSPLRGADVEEGGETTFPGGKWLDKEAQLQPPYSQCGQKGVAVKPRKGDALLFFSLHPNGEGAWQAEWLGLGRSSGATRGQLAACPGLRVVNTENEEADVAKG